MGNNNSLRENIEYLVERYEVAVEDFKKQGMDKNTIFNIQCIIEDLKMALNISEE